jgi:hypothetical protein
MPEVEVEVEEKTAQPAVAAQVAADQVALTVQVLLPLQELPTPEVVAEVEDDLMSLVKPVVLVS